METPQTRTLQRALALLGGSKAGLAAALDITGDELQAYLDGTQPLPDLLFLDALDIVAGMSIKPRRRM
jgi:hypothetical protein